MTDPLPRDGYVWWDDMRILEAAHDADAAGPDETSTAGDTGYKPREEDPPWALPLAVLILVVTVYLAGAVVTGAIG